MWLGLPIDPLWLDFPQGLTRENNARQYVSLFETLVTKVPLNDCENLALRASSLRAIPPPSPEVQSMEGLSGVNLLDASLIQWASYILDVAAGMR